MCDRSEKSFRANSISSLYQARPRKNPKSILPCDLRFHFKGIFLRISCASHQHVVPKWVGSREVKFSYTMISMILDKNMRWSRVVILKGGI